MPNKAKISESIFNGKTMIIPMADVQHIEKQIQTHDLANGAKKGDIRGYIIITKHTRWSIETNFWANNIFLDKEEGERFLQAWCAFRHELDEVNA